MANLATIDNNILADSGIDPIDLIVGTGTVNYVPKFTAEGTIGNSQIFDNGTNVGIGTASPSYKLDIYGGTSGTRTDVFVSNAGGNYNIGVLADNNGFASTSNSMLFYTSASERMRITSAGNVGIGTSSPAQKLVVIGNTAISGVTYTDYIQTYSGASIDFRHQDASVIMRVDTANARVGIGTTSPLGPLDVRSTGLAQIYFGYPNAGEYGYLGRDANSGLYSLNIVQNANLAIWTNNTERMRITSTGNVGIGTSSPMRALNIVSNNAQIRISDSTAPSTNYWEFSSVFFNTNQDLFISNQSVTALTINSSGNVGIGTSSPSFLLTVSGKIYSSTEIQASTAVMNTTGGYASFGSNSGSIPVRVSRDASLSDIIIDTTGYVGIGTSTPSDKLHVSGNLRVTGTIIDSNNSPGTSGQVLSSTATGTDWVSLSEITGVDGTGTANYVAKWLDANTITNSLLYDNGTTVAIGTTATNGSRLQVQGNTDIWHSLNTLLRLYHDGTRAVLQSYTGGGYSNIALNADGGNVGIGTSTPAVKLHVVGDGYFTSSVAITSGVGTAVGQLSLYASPGTGVVTNLITAQYSSNVLTSIQSLNAGGYYQDLIINTSNGAGAPTLAEVFRIKGQTGNVGIGTASPNVLLEVNGQIRSTRIGVASQYLQIDGGNASGPFITAAGVAKVLSIVNNSSVNAEIWFNNAVASNYIWYQVGAEVMRITAAGDVGIGTSAPDSKLTVVSSGSNLFRMVRSQNNFGFEATATSSGGYGLYDYQASAYDIYFKAGNVGIGTTTPGGKLHVAPSLSDGAINQSIILSAAGGTAAGAYGGYIGQRVVSGNQRQGTIVNGTGSLTLNASNYNIDFILGAVTPTNDSNLKMRITSTGDVGIGVAAPTSRLFIYTNGVGTTANGIGMDNGAQQHFWYLSDNTTSTFEIGSTAGVFKWANSNGERMRITAAGDVGIGTSAPQNKLTVKGATDYNLNLGILGSYAGIYALNDVGNAYKELRIDASTLILNGYSGGNVGINTASPSYKLHVNGTGGFSSYVGTLLGSGGLFLSGDPSPDYAYLGYNYTNVSGVEAVGQDIRNSWRIRFGNGAVKTMSFGYRVGSAAASAFTEYATLEQTGQLKLNLYGSGTFTGTRAYDLSVDASGNIIEVPVGAGTITGSGTTNYVSKFTGASSIGNSVLYDDGTDVGIGTTSPAPYIDGGAARGLQISNAGRAGIRLHDTGGVVQYFDIGVNGSTAFISAIYSQTPTIKYQAASNHIFENNSSESMRITSAGNIGIGTSFPDERLHILGNEIIGNSTYDGSYGYYLRFPFKAGNLTAGTIRAHIQFDSVHEYSVNSNDTWKWKIAAVAREGNGGNYNSSLEFMRTTRIGVTDETVLALNGYTGYVGIGTTAPSQKLEVKGTDSSTVQAIFQANAGAAVAYNGGIQLGNGAANQNSQIYHNSSGDNTLTFVSNYSSGTANKFIFAPGGTERVRFLQNGNVGIGTTNPIAKLHVAGTAYFTSDVSAAIFNSLSLGTATVASTGWYKIASIDTRGGGTIQVCTTGGSYSPTTYNINYYKDWSNAGTLQLSQYGPSSWITDARIRQDSANNIYYVEIYVAAVAAFEVYHQKLLGYNATGTVFTGALAAGSASGTTITQLPFRTYGLTTQGITLTPFNNTSAVAFQRNVSGTIYNLGSITNSGSDIMYQGTGNVFINADSDGDSTSEARNVIFGNRGVEYMRVNGSGYVGIGTTAPNEKLDVRGNIYIPQNNYIYFDNSGHYIRRGASDVEIQGYNGIQLRTSGTTRLYINEIGNVGIGTTAPTANLHVNSSSNTYVKVSSSSGTDYAGVQFENSGDATHAWSMYRDAIGNMMWSHSTGATIGQGTTTYPMVITTGDNVGIGTTAPAYKLQVESGTNASVAIVGAAGYQTALELKGADQWYRLISQPSINGYRFDIYNQTLGAFAFSIASNLDTYLYGKAGIGTTSPQSRLDLAPPASQSTVSTLGYSANAQLNIRIPNSTGDIGQIVFTNDAAPTAGYASIGVIMTNGTGVGIGDIIMCTKSVGSNAASTERMRINSSGYVSIGTSSADEILTVAGKIKASSMYVYDGLAAGQTGIGATASGGTLRLYSNGNIGATITSAGAMTVTSSVTATGFFESSDARLKTIVDENYRHNAIANIKPKFYEKNGKFEAGYIAQDVQEIYEHAVSLGTDGYLSLSYGQIHTLKIAYLEDTVEEIKRKIAYLEQQLNNK